MSEAATETVTQTVTEPSANGSKPAAKTTTTKTTAKPVAPPKPPKVLRESAIIPIIMVGFGAYLLWFGVKYWRGAGAATWPSYPIKSILQGKGIPPNTPAPSAEAELATTEQPTPSGTIAGYANPFAQSKGLTTSRIDQGVDFGGSGPVSAIGPGIVTYAGEGDTGWGPPNGPAPGGFISYRLTGGPAAGHEVYVAEGITPAVTAGQKVSAGEIIGHMNGSSIETGWASGVGTQPLSQTPQAGGIGGSGPFPTRVGVNFDRLLIALGVPAAPNLAQSASGELPSGYPDTWNTGEVTTGRPQNIAKMLLGSFGWGSGQFSSLDKLWVRESGWRSSARNPTTGAYGIAQAYTTGDGPGGPPGTESNEYTAAYGLSNAQARAANSGNILQQIRWGLGYIKGRYGTPGAAWRHEQQFGWY